MENLKTLSEGRLCFCMGKLAGSESQDQQGEKLTDRVFNL